MNLLRHAPRPLGRGQPPLIRQFWLRRTLKERPSAPGDDAQETESQLTERGDAAPDDQT